MKIPTSFPINFAMITDDANNPVWAPQSFATSADGTEQAVFVALHPGASTASTSYAVTTMATQFVSTTPTTDGFTFNDGFGTGQVSAAKSQITAIYRPGASPTVPTPTDWPSGLVPAATGTGATWRLTLIERDADGTVTATFVCDKVLGAADLAAIATASTSTLSPQPAPDGGVAFTTKDGLLGAWVIHRGGFVVSIAGPAAS